MSSKRTPKNNWLLVFDPGATTGVALLRNGKTTSTFTLEAIEVDLYARVMASRNHLTVIIEVGPTLQHSNPLTRRVEANLRQRFPHAHLIQPSQWKGHPASKSQKRDTQHERDAEGLGHWFYATRSNDGQSQGEHDASRTDSARSGRERH